MIKAKQLADRLPYDLLPKTKSCAALLTATSQLKTDRNNALLRITELETALVKIYDSPSNTDTIIDIAFTALNGEV